MTADALLLPIVSSLAGYIAFLAIPLLGFSIIGMIGRR